MSGKLKNAELNDKQERFCVEYCVDLNATQAAKRAGYEGDDATLGVTGSRLLKNDKVSERISQLKANQYKKIENKADDVLRELMRMGYSDPRELFTETGAIKPPSEWSDDLARAISSIDVKEEFSDYTGVCPTCNRENQFLLIGFTKKVKFWPKDRGLEMLGKNKKLFTDKFEVDVKDPLAERLRKARDKKK